MCGRYTNHTPPEAYAELLHAIVRTEPWSPRYNIAPSDRVLACRTGSDGQRELVNLRWGLVPFWADDPRIGYKMINARAETVADKPAFRRAFRQRRCLICADGFYEWKQVPGGKQPYFIQMRDGEPLLFAGLWEHWSDHQGQSIDSCTIIVTEANTLLRRVHDRMPVILSPTDIDVWLDPQQSEPDTLRPLLSPYPAKTMVMQPVSRAVNSPRNDGPELIEPLSEVP